MVDDRVADDRGTLINLSLAREFADTIFAESHGAFADHLGAGLIYYALATALRAQVSVCIGSGGGFVPLLLHRAQMDLHLANAQTYLIDANLPELAFGSPRDRGGWLTPDSKLQGVSNGMTILRMLSADAVKIFTANGITIDYLHIDGDHSTRGMLADLNAYLPILSAVSTVSFHDLRMKSVALALEQFTAQHPGIELLSFPELGNGTGIIRKRTAALPPVLDVERFDRDRRTSLSTDVFADDVAKSQDKARFERWHYLETTTYKLRYELVRSFVDLPGATIVEIGGYPNSILGVLDQASRVIAIEPYLPPAFVADVQAQADRKKIELVLSPGSVADIKIDVAAMAPYRLVALGFDISSGSETRDDLARSLTALVELSTGADLIAIEIPGFIPSEIAFQALSACIDATVLHDVTLDLSKDPVAETYFVKDLRAQRHVLVLKPGTPIPTAAATIIIQDAARRLAEFQASSSGDDPEYYFGDKIEFHSGTSAGRFLADGWSALEADFVWAIGVQSKLRMRIVEIPDNTETLVLCAAFHPFIVPGKIDSQRLTIKVNNTTVFDQTISAYEALQVPLPRHLVDAKSGTEIVILHPDCARPIDLLPHQIPDRRVLSVGLESLRLALPS